MILHTKLYEICPKLESRYKTIVILMVGAHSPLTDPNWYWYKRVNFLIKCSLAYLIQKIMGNLKIGFCGSVFHIHADTSPRQEWE
jgi:hypothetical protein